MVLGAGCLSKQQWIFMKSKPSLRKKTENNEKGERERDCDAEKELKSVNRIVHNVIIESLL